MRTVFFVSDGTGLTAEMLGHSLLSQFAGIEFKRVTLPFINSPEKASAALETIHAQAKKDQNRPIVFCTLVDPAVKPYFRTNEALILDPCDAFVSLIENELGAQSSHRVGAAHAIEDLRVYMGRIAAVNFAMAHDDGVLPRDLAEADLILVGVSRSGKTPTCLYLALHFGIKVANYPLTPEDFGTQDLPNLLAPWKEKLFGLTIAPERLAEIRGERTPNSRYAAANNCRFEIEEAEALMRRCNIPYLDTTRLSIEELATTILHRTGLARFGGGAG